MKPQCNETSTGKSDNPIKVLFVILLVLINFLLWPALIKPPLEVLSQKQSRSSPSTSTISGKPDLETKKLSSQENTATVTLPSYSILKEEVYETPGKAQVIMSILVSGEISEPGLKALLNNLYSSVKTRKGFKYHDSPTVIDIRAFTSKERFESDMGQWIMALQKRPGQESTFNIDTRQMAQLGKKPETKWGLSEAERKQIWTELVKAEDRATKEAEAVYPDLDPLDPGYSQSAFLERFEKREELGKTLSERYKQEVAKKYGLTQKQLKEISMEGLVKSWPFPRY